MTKIKIIGALIFLFSLLLAFIFSHTSKNVTRHNNEIAVMNAQKNFTQDISKNIFYFYKYPDSPSKALDDSIKLFLENMDNQEKGLHKDEKIRKLWNDFYLHVQRFRDQIKNKTIYSTILLEKEVKIIYDINRALMAASDNFINGTITRFNQEQNIYTAVQYLLFFILVSLLLYLFTQLKNVITFIQKFLLASKEILSQTSIKTLKPIEIEDNNNDILEAKENFNKLVQKINDSIASSTQSMEHTYKSLEIVEQNIENLVELIYAMSEDSRDKELKKKEDAIIQSFEELSISAKKLKNLKSDLDDLITHTKP
ncbi:MAG: hypothetical protein PHX44_08925 [Sulfurimonas sp.]|uniref:hypothetical protein n=1 Tax=Sulfurimonas sp. TaxID=2022749 RepID=UPI00262F1F7D|nr:hypothetical protein [Sulfurimonas sp.]MDD2653155.1 hypothetical protein [Sulfurimonas sp.]MDD3450577.1 hypothetical protein [Sulfurimonas sp.]